MNLPESLTHLAPLPSKWEARCLDLAKRPSAVLVLFVQGFATSLDLKLLLIRRSTRVGTHPGQIGFPGGRLEKQDPSPAATALRETSEELGILPQSVKLLGILPSAASIDGSLVFPVVGIIHREELELTLNPSEVQCVYQVPWDLITHKNRKFFAFNMFGCW
jgi:8-oxo-dGTP pyrophosphatase MutT (NUDIX family)